MQNWRAIHQFKMAEIGVVQFMKDQPLKCADYIRHDGAILVQLFNRYDAPSRDLHNQIMRPHDRRGNPNVIHNFKNGIVRHSCSIEGLHTRCSAPP